MTFFCQSNYHYKFCHCIECRYKESWLYMLKSCLVPFAQPKNPSLPSPYVCLYSSSEVPQHNVFYADTRQIIIWVPLCHWNIETGKNKSPINIFLYLTLSPLSFLNGSSSFAPINSFLYLTLSPLSFLNGSSSFELLHHLFWTIFSGSTLFAQVSVLKGFFKSIATVIEETVSAVIIFVIIVQTTMLKIQRIALPRQFLQMPKTYLQQLQKVSF